jgi:hypothetical protein
MPNALMTQTVTNDYGGIALDNVSSFKYGHLTLIWNLTLTHHSLLLSARMYKDSTRLGDGRRELGFGVFYPEKSKGSESKKGDF